MNELNRFFNTVARHAEQAIRHLETDSAKTGRAIDAATQQIARALHTAFTPPTSQPCRRATPPPVLASASASSSSASASSSSSSAPAAPAHASSSSSVVPRIANEFFERKCPLELFSVFEQYLAPLPETKDSLAAKKDLIHLTSVYPEALATSKIRAQLEGLSEEDFLNLMPDLPEGLLMTLLQERLPLTTFSMEDYVNRLLPKLSTALAISMVQTHILINKPNFNPIDFVAAVLRKHINDATLPAYARHAFSMPEIRDRVTHLPLSVFTINSAQLRTILTRAQQFPKLTSLDIGGAGRGIENDSIAVVAELLPNLHEINLTNSNQVNSGCLPSLLKMPHLKGLRIRGCGLGNTAEDQLRRRFGANVILK